MASAAETLTKETEEGAKANNRLTSDGAEEFQDAPETLARADGGDPMDVDKEEEKARVLNASETLLDGGDLAVVAGENLDGEEEKVCFRSAPATLVSVDGGYSTVVSEESVKNASETLVWVDGRDSAVVAKVNLDDNGEKVAVQNASETLIPVEGGDSTMVTKENPIVNGEKVLDSEKYAVKIDGGDGRVRYYLPHGEDNAGFSATDMVWGKVKSHPWWPGQIFDPKYTSDLASKHQKKDQLLVAYFGDKTFAWCEQSQLKPFVSAFAQMERQTGMDAFTSAVKDAIEEVSRRVELGMSCLCAADEAYTNLKYRVIENAGIREGTCSSVVDKGLIVNSFEPKRLLEFVVALARCPSWGVDTLELATAKAQVKGFYRSKGHAELPVFVIGGGLLDNDDYVTPPKSKKSGKSNAEDSDVKKSRGRPKKFKDVSERKFKDVLEKKLIDVPEDAKDDVKVVSDDLATLSGKKRPRGRPRKLQNASENGKGGKLKDVSEKKLKDVPEDAKEDLKVVSDDSATLSGKKRPRGRPRKVQNASENGEGGKLKDVPEKKQKDVPEDAKEDVKVVSDDSATLSGKKRPRGRPCKVQNASENGEEGKLKDVPEKKLKDVLEDAKENVKVVNDDSATLSGKKRPRGRPRKVQNASENSKGCASGWKSTPRASAKKHDDDDPNHRGEGRSRKKRVDYLEMVSQPSSARSMSVKIGERIRNVASQVQGSPPIFKYNSEELQSIEPTRMKSVTKKEYASVYEMLSQLCLVAVDPMGMYSFLSMTVSFFTDYKATISTDSSEELMPSKSKGGKRGRRKKTVDSDPESLDMPMADSYWNDLLLQSSPEREPVSRGRKRKRGSKGKKQKKAKSAAMVDNERGPKVNTSIPSPTDHQELAGVGPSSDVAGRLEEAGEGSNSNAAGKIKGAGEGPRSDAVEKFEQAEGPGSSSLETPTALILSFTEPDALPTEADLMRIFSDFGPLKEAETEILRKTNRAKVVFKSRTDAELAFNSAGKYSVFGSALVSYRLRYLQPLPKGSPGNSAQDKDITHTEAGNTELPAEEDNSVASGNTSAQVMGNSSTQ